MNPFSWKFAPTPKNSKYFFLHRSTLSSQHIIISIVISYHHITSSYHIISKKLWKMTKSYCSWTLFFLEICPNIQNLKYSYYTGQHYHHITSSYQIVISYHHITSSYHIISKKLWKMTKSYCSWTLFSRKFAPRSKIQNIFPTQSQHYHHITSSYHIIISHRHIISSYHIIISYHQ